MATSTMQPTAAADQPSESKHALVINALDQYWPNWRTNGCVLLPPIFKWNNPIYGQAALDDRASVAKELAHIPGPNGQRYTPAYDQANKFGIHDESSRSEHIVYRAFNELINSDGENFQLAPLFGFAKLELSNGNDAFDDHVWADVQRTLKKPKEVLGELDFTIIGPKIGLVLIEVKSSPYPKDFIIGSKYLLSKRLKEELEKFDASTANLRSLLEKSTIGSHEFDSEKRIDDWFPIRRVVLFTNVERTKFNDWFRSLDEESKKCIFVNSETWLKEHLQNEDESRWPLFTELRTLLDGMAKDVEKLDEGKKKSLLLTYKAFVPIMVGMKSLISGGGPTPALLNKEQLSMLTAIVAEDRKLDEHFGLMKDAIASAAAKTQNPEDAAAITTLQFVKKQYFLTPDQQGILHGGPRKLIFGRAGVGKTLLLYEKIRQVIEEERRKAKEEGHQQLPVLIMVSKSITGEYERFLRDICEFENGTDYLFDDETLFNLDLDKVLETILPNLFKFAKRTKQHRAMLTWFEVCVADNMGQDHIGGNMNAVTNSPFDIAQKALIRRSHAAFIFESIIDRIDDNTLRWLITKNRLVEFLRFVDICAEISSKMGLNDQMDSNFGTFDALTDFLKSKGFSSTIIEFVQMVFPMENYHELAKRSRQIDNELGVDVSDLDIFIGFSIGALNDDAIYSQIKTALSSAFTGCSHVFVDDLLDDDLMSLLYPQAFEIGVVLILELFKRVNPQMCVWIAVDPNKRRIADADDKERSPMTVANLGRLQTYADANRFELCTLRDVMRCSKQIFEHCYEREEQSGAEEWRKWIQPRLGHNYNGTTPMVGRGETLQTFEEAQELLWSKLKDTILFLEKQGFTKEQFALIVGDRHEFELGNEHSLFGFLESKCSDELQRLGRIVYLWSSVSSLEWTVVIYANILPKDFEVKFNVYQRYRAMSRAKVHLIEYEYFYCTEMSSVGGAREGNFFF